MLRITEQSLSHWALRAVVILGVAAGVVWVPSSWAAGRIGDATAALELVIAAMALNLVLGYMGQISFGHSAFIGMGAYTTGVLVTQFDWAPPLTLLPAVGIAFVAGVLVGYPALRLRGLYFALVTLAVAVLFPQLVKWPHLASLTGGARGMPAVAYEQLPAPPLLGPLSGRHGSAVLAYWSAVLLVLVCYATCWGIVNSRVGRSLVAVRDNEIAAEVMGVSLARTKTVIFGISASMCALAGSLMAVRTSYISADITSMTVIGGVTFVLVMIVGGSGTLIGPVIGGLCFVAFDLWTQSLAASGSPVFDTIFGWMDTSPAVLIVSAVMILMMFVAPSGIVGVVKRLLRRLVTIEPAPIGTAAGLEAADPDPEPVQTSPGRTSSGCLDTQQSVVSVPTERK